MELHRNANNFKKCENELSNKNSQIISIYSIKDNKSLEKIFLKVHLSLYTTLSSYDSVLFLLSKAQNQEIENYIKPNEEDKNDEGNEPEADVKISMSAIGTIQSMVNYIYDIINPVLLCMKCFLVFLRFLMKMWKRCMN